MASLQKLETLILSNAYLSDKSIITIAKLPELKKLVLSGTNITGVTLNLLNNPKLRTIDFRDTPLIDSGIYNLKNMNWIEEINITNTKVSVSAIEKTRQLDFLPYTILIADGKQQGYLKNQKAYETRKLNQIDISPEKKVKPELIELNCIVRAQQDLNYMDGYAGGYNVIDSLMNENGECAVIAEGVLAKSLSFRPTSTLFELRKQIKSTSFPCTKELKDNLHLFGNSTKCLVNSKQSNFKVGTYQPGKFSSCGCQYERNGR